MQPLMLSKTLEYVKNYLRMLGYLKLKLTDTTS